MHLSPLGATFLRGQIGVFAAMSLATLLLTVTACAEEQLEKLPADAAFKIAANLMEKGQHKKAIPYLERVQKELPDDPSVLWNLGLALAETGAHSKAVETWRSYRRAAPDDWLARAKLVQGYQALGDLKARDDEIKSLYDYRENSSDSKVKAAERFCREQSVLAGRSVFVFEYFSPQGPWQKYFRFSVLNKKGDEAFYLSLGSYDVTTEIARELGEIPKNERMYHLDEYGGNLHKTYGLFKAKPEYDQLRRMVLDILEGKLKPVSASSR
jgi:tetratricopeptide (TPR) repeat protein